MSNLGSLDSLFKFLSEQGSDVAFSYDQITWLRAILHRFKKDQLLTVVLETLNITDQITGLLHERTLDKKEIVDCIIASLLRLDRDADESIYALEIKYSQLNRSSRQWSTFHIKDPERFVERTTNSRKFAKKLTKELERSHLNFKVMCDFFEDAMWTLILSFKKPGRPKKVFLIMYPHIPVVVHSHMTNMEQDVIIRSIVQLFLGSAVEKLPVYSNNIETVLVYSNEHFKLKVPNEEIVDLPTRNLEDEPSEDLENIINLDKEEENRRNAYVLDNFGAHQEVPLQVLKYRVISEFELGDEENSTRNATLRVAFKGKNVLEGMLKLVRSGAAEYPIPKIMMHAGAEQYGNEISVKVKRARNS